MGRIPLEILEKVSLVLRPPARRLRIDPILDQALGNGVDDGIALGVIHEWITAEEVESKSIVATSKAKSADAHSRWFAPHGVVLALAWGMLRADDGEQGRQWGSHTDASHDAVAGRSTAWIGRRVWPSPRAMLGIDGSRALLARSIFVDTDVGGPRRELANRLWAVQQSLACDGVMTVVWDASHFDLVATRRLQLATTRDIHDATLLACHACHACHAERPPVLALAVRPWHERLVTSAATTRWIVRNHRDSNTDDPAPHWQAELVRGRGASGSRVGQCAFTVRASWSWNGGRNPPSQRDGWSDE